MIPLRRRAALPALLGAAVATAAAASPGPPPRPEGCRHVAASEPLQPLLAAAADGAAFCLAEGRHAGPLHVTRRATLWGTRDAVIAAGGVGTTVRLDAEGSALLGLSVDGSGGRFDQLDAAIRVGADAVRVEGVAVHGALFGILVEQARAVVLRGNEIHGNPSAALGLRGDAIRLWEVRGSLVEGNRVGHGRDVVVWYSPGNVFRGNRVEGGRYGTHFMYSHGNRVEDNRYVGNVVGIFVMYSRDLHIESNLLADSKGAAGVGLGAKESGDLRVRRNRFVGNTTAVYLDTSPLYDNEWNRFEENVFLLGDAGVVFHASPRRNSFTRNGFRDNGIPVRVEGRGDALGVEWRGNRFDDYRGYDLDGDGVGDLPYELRSLSEDLASREPSLAFFRGSPAMGLVEMVGRMVPLFQPRTVLRDPEPRMRGPRLGDARAH